MKILTPIFLICYLQLMGQQTSPCIFDEYLEKTASQKQQIDKILAEKSVQILQDRRGQRGVNDTFIIPVVVHVIHNGGAENITDAQIQSQIQVLNEDFRKISGTNGDGNGVDTKIQFCLARKNPEGRCCNGIVRIKSDLTNHQNYERASLARLSSWDPSRYLNIYIVKTMQSGTLGYASYPGSPLDQDGVVVRHNAFGTLGTALPPNNLGRTTTHELGHWFGLYHTFNDSCGNDACMDGDHVCDTPPVAEPNYGCPDSVNSCHNDFPDLYDLHQNYMDYTDDNCKNQFTEGQAARMQATLENIRIQIWNAGNLMATGCDTGYIIPASCTPIADFVTSTQEICTGGSVYFMSRSLNNDTAWKWYFEGGIDSISHLQNPTVTYQSPGSFAVKLVVQSPEGTDSILRTDYITVNERVSGIQQSWGENFENDNFPANGLSIDNPDNGITWERTMDAAYEGNASVRIQNLVNTNYGQSDALLLPRIDFTSLPTPIKLGFKWAYARSDANYSDELIVVVSDNCGIDWTQKFYRTGNGLATGPTQTTLFLPDSTQWKTANVDLSAYSISDHVDIKIVNVTDGGNALYIDSLKLGEFDFNTIPSSIKKLERQVNVFLYPNPSQNSIIIRTEKTDQRITEIQIKNLTGEKVLHVLNLNTTQTIINTTDLPGGLYIVTIKLDDNYSMLKFIKQ